MLLQRDPACPQIECFEHWVIIPLQCLLLLDQRAQPVLILLQLGFDFFQFGIGVLVRETFRVLFCPVLASGFEEETACPECLLEFVNGLGASFVLPVAVLNRVFPMLQVQSAYPRMLLC